MSTWIQQLIGFITVLTMGYAGYGNVAPGGQINYPTPTPQMYAQTSTESTSTTSTSDPAAMCASAGGAWSPSATPPCVMPGSSGGTTSTTTTSTSQMTPQGACTTANGYWCGTYCAYPPATCGGTSTTSTSSMACPADQYWSNGVCVPMPSSTMSTSCSSGMYWNGSSCVANPPSTNTTTWSPPTPASCAASNQTYCSSSSGGSGWCQTGPCPTSTTPSTTPSTWTAPTSCPSGQNLCPSSGGGSSWCQSGSCPTSTPSTSTSTWTTPTIESCRAQNMNYYCASSSGGSGWCSSSECPPSTAAACAAKGWAWCADSTGMTSGGCMMSAGPCPNATPSPSPTSCGPGMNLCSVSGSSYCAATCPTATPSPTPPPTLSPILPVPPAPTTVTCPPLDRPSDKYKCTPQGPYASSTPWCSSMPCNQSECTGEFEWCDPAPTMATTAMYTPQGWCQTKSANNGCPAYTEVACKAKAGSWCQPSGGGTGWCATGGATCPNENKDKQDCATRGDEWCLPMGVGGYGWCAGKQSGGCPARTQTECSQKQGKWCKNPPMATGTMMAGMPDGYCTTGPYAECPIHSKSDCTAAGRSWCVNTYASSAMYSPMPADNGWCASKGSTCPPGQEPKPEPKPELCPLSPSWQCRANEEPDLGPAPCYTQKGCKKSGKQSPCPIAMYMPCPQDSKEETYTNEQGCTMQRCVKKGGPEPLPCPMVMPPKCADNEEVVWKYNEGGSYLDSCSRAECRPRKDTCALPPPASQCPAGWIANYGTPSYGDARVLTVSACPWYECRNTEHDRMETCVKTAVGETLFAQMKSGKLPEKTMRSLMAKIEAAGCFGVVPPPPPPPGPDEPRPVPECDVKRVQRDMSRDLVQELNRIDKAVKRLRERKITVPVMYEAILTRVKTLIETMKNTKTCEDMYSLGQDLPDLMRQLNSQLQGIEHLERVGAMVKQLNQELKRVQTAWNKVARRLQASLRQEREVNFKDAVALVVSTVKAVQAAAADADPDKIETLTRQAYEALATAGRVVSDGEMMVGATKFMRQARADIRKSLRLIKEMKEAEEDIEGLQDTVKALQAMVKEGEGKRVACAKTQTNECQELFAEFMASWDDLKEEIAYAEGYDYDERQYRAFSGIGGMSKGIEEFFAKDTYKFFEQR